MIILGILGILLAGCLGVIPLFKDAPEFQQAVAAQLKEQRIELDTLMLGFIVMAVVVLFWSIAQIVLGVIVRRATTVPVAMSLALTAATILALLVFILISLVGGDIGGLACNIVFAALVAIQLVWLIQAMKNAGPITAMQTQYQMWGYASPGMPPIPSPPQGYGYGHVPPPRTPPVQPPPEP